jgi:hypothetical protein
LQLLERTLKGVHPPDLEIESDFSKEMIYQHRRFDQLDYYFIANLSERKGETRLKFQIHGRVEVWDPDTGEARRIPNTTVLKGHTHLKYEFQPYEGLFFIISPNDMASPKQSINSNKRLTILPPIEIGGWWIEPQTPNLFLLEPWRVRLLDDSSGEERELWTTRYDSLEAISEGNRKRAESEGMDPSEATLFMKLARDPNFLERIRAWPPEGSRFEQRTSFQLRTLPPDLELIYEDLGEPVILKINGRDYTGNREHCFVWDRSNLRISLHGWVKQGENVISLETQMPSYRSLPPSVHGLEPVVIRGSFIVKEGSLVEPSNCLSSLSSWTELGWPNYSGAMNYRTSFTCPKHYLGRRLDLVFENVRETVDVKINGNGAGFRLWPPYRLDISRFVKEGTNDLTATVTNTLSNLMTRPIESGLIGAVQIETAP